MNRVRCFMLLLALGFSQLLLAADEGANLFEYPQVPDTISSLERRSDYLIANFWANLDMTKQIKDREGLRSAFVDYVTFFPYANALVVTNSLGDLFYKAQGNSSNFRLLAEISESVLYSFDAPMRSDATYYVVLSKVLESNSLSSEEKLRYKAQMDILINNKTGAKASEFKYKDIKGKSKKFGKFDTDYTIIYFSDPSCEECLIGRLRLSVDVELNNLIKQGKVKLYSMSLVDYSKEWAEEAKEYSQLWEIGATAELYDLYDLRLMPNLYILDKDGTILAKNVAKLPEILNVVSK